MAESLITPGLPLSLPTSLDSSRRYQPHLAARAASFTLLYSLKHAIIPIEKTYQSWTKAPSYRRLTSSTTNEARPTTTLPLVHFTFSALLPNPSSPSLVSLANISSTLLSHLGPSLHFGFALINSTSNFPSQYLSFGLSVFYDCLQLLLEEILCLIQPYSGNHSYQ